MHRNFSVFLCLVCQIRAVCTVQRVPFIYYIVWVLLVRWGDCQYQLYAVIWHPILVYDTVEATGLLLPSLRMGATAVDPRMDTFDDVSRFLHLVLTAPLTRCGEPTSGALLIESPSSLLPLILSPLPRGAHMATFGSEQE